jgi:hypothetical protein
VTQADRSLKKIKAGGSRAWGRYRMNKTHRKGRKHAKSQTSRDRRLLDQAVIKAEQK